MSSGSEKRPEPSEWARVVTGVILGNLDRLEQNRSIVGRKAQAYYLASVIDQIRKEGEARKKAYDAELTLDGLAKVGEEPSGNL